MPLDPDIRAMLDRLAAEQAVSREPVTLERARQDYRRQYREMSAAPEGDVAQSVVPLPGGKALLHVYRPVGLSGPSPVILYLHGGGFVLGDAETYAPQSIRIALECGAVVAFLDYRLAPEHPFPAALEDTLAAVDWLAGNMDAIGGDAARLALMGDSAGANLSIAAMLHHRQRSPFKCACLLYPLVDARPYVGLSEPSVSDREFATGYYLEFAEAEYFASAYLSDPVLANDPRVSPVLADDLGELPPVFFHAAEYDVLRDQGRDFAARLEAAGNAVEYRCFDGLIHNFMQHAGISRRSDAAFRDVCGSVRRALGTAVAEDA